MGMKEIKGAASLPGGGEGGWVAGETAGSVGGTGVIPLPPAPLPHVAGPRAVLTSCKPGVLLQEAPLAYAMQGQWFHPGREEIRGYLPHDKPATFQWVACNHSDCSAGPSLPRNDFNCIWSPFLFSWQKSHFSRNCNSLASAGLLLP